MVWNLTIFWANLIQPQSKLLPQKILPTSRVSIAFEEEKSTTLNGSMKSAIGDTLSQEESKVNISRKHPNSLTPNDIRR